MTRMNWTRLMLGTLVAAVIMFLTDGLFHERMVGTDWTAVYTHLGSPEPHHDASGIIYFAFSVTGPAQFIPLGFYSTVLWWKVAAFQLATSIAAVLIGAALYRDA